MNARKSFPILLDCGQTPMLHVEATESEFEYITIDTEMNGNYDTELVVRLRLKCDHQSHKADGDGE